MVVPGSDVKLLVRLGTSDIVVFNDTYHGKEHEWDFPRAPEVILDAGAYTGLSTAFFAMRYPGARVIAIEPSEQNFTLLAQNVAAFKNVQIIKAALWSESGSVVVTDPGRDSWGMMVAEPDSSTINGNHVGAQSTVRALTVSDVMRECKLDRIDLLKLDIEGSEKEVFSNADSWIKDVDAISVELHDRFKSGCSRAFFCAVSDFPIELRRGEKILVVRDGSLMSPLG